MAAQRHASGERGRTDAEDRVDVDRLDLVPRERQLGEVGREDVGPKWRAVPERRRRRPVEDQEELAGEEDERLGRSALGEGWCRAAPRWGRTPDRSSESSALK